MPYVSDAQRKFFNSPGAAKAGITPAQVEEWNKSSEGLKLPERKLQIRKGKKRRR